MAVTVRNSAAHVSGSSTTTSMSWTLSVFGDNDRILLAAVAWTGSGTVSVTANGEALAPLDNQANASSTYHTRIFYLLNPAATGADGTTITVTASVACYMIGFSAIYSGVLQQAPLYYGSLTGNSFGLSGMTVNSPAEGAVAFETFAMANATSSVTNSSGQTLDFYLPHSTAARTLVGSHTTSPLAAGAGKAIGWTISGSTAREWGQSMVFLLPTGSVAPNFLSFFMP